MDEYTIAQIQSLIAQNKLSSQELVKQYLEEIENIDRKGPKLNSVLNLNPNALKEAIELDRERTTKGNRSLLYGIPIIIKDNVCTIDQMPTTAGSLALKAFYPENDADFVSQLRNAGAIILGKANLSEWANFRGKNSTSGWSSCGGQTKNPYVLNRTPCGSSSGSAVAVAANLCVVAIGTETDGSILCPAHINSIVGIKPTVGLISQKGIVPIAHSQDTAGPMGRCVADTAAVLSIMVDRRPNGEVADPAGLLSSRPRELPNDYTQFLDPAGLHGTRIGVLRSVMGFHPKVDALFNECLKKMEDAGAVIFDPIELEIDPKLEDAELEVLLYEFKADLNQFLADRVKDIPIHSLEDLIAYNEQNRDAVLPYFGQELFKLAQAKGGLETKEYQELVEQCRLETRKNGIDKAMADYQIEAIAAPTASVACPIDLVNGDHFLGSSTELAAVAGYPAITVPMGYIHGLPAGISFFSTAYQEPRLIKIAYAFEQVIQCRQPPQFKPTLNLF